MTAEERVQQVIGAQTITICTLQAQVEQLQKQLAEKPKEDVKPNGA